MLGAGVFSAFGPASAQAGSWLPLALVIAAAVATLNAGASAQLAAQFPTSGGTYAYGRALLGPRWGFAAGWSFVVGKTASCAAMALTAAGYAVPGGGAARTAVAVAVVAAFTWLNCRGVHRTTAATTGLVAITLGVLALTVAVAFTAPRTTAPEGATSALGVLTGAGLVFFAFAGYARIATLGEEVMDPRRTIPRAIAIALTLTVLVYAAVVVALLWSLGPDALARSPAPLTDAVTAAGTPAAGTLVRVGAIAASLGALLALQAGLGRTMLAMAREGDLPRALAAVHPRHRVPHRAEVMIGLAAIALVLLGDLRQAIGFSSFGVLLYYAIANLSAWRQTGPNRRRPRSLDLVGLFGCLLLVVTLPRTDVVIGTAVVAIGVAGREVLHQVRGT